MTRCRMAAWETDLCWSVQFNEKLRKFTGVGVFISLGPISVLKCVRREPRKF